MELKPIITNCGDEKLYSQLSPEIERRLPQTCVEWERPLGTSKSVFLQASFVKFDASSLVSTADTRANISKQPFLHIYWTGVQEFDKYKYDLKDRILEWLKLLRDKGINNWLVIQVYSQDDAKASKPKLVLPRGSVFDKIKNEVCNKDPEKCFQLWEPMKETLFSKSVESWQGLLRQVRLLLLRTIEQHLSRYEDTNRNCRERYSQPDWSFTKYFILHEELALILKSVTLHEDALVKYDELDALLSQFILNSENRSPPLWLRQFMKALSSWDGISLHKEKVRSRRDLVHDGSASLLDLRNYLFARQCQLLNKLGKTNDIARRLHELVYAVRKELAILQIEVPPGAFHCWIALSCLYFLQYFESKKPSDKTTLMFLSQTTDYARQKLRNLGDLCDLLPIEPELDCPNGIGELLLKGLSPLDDKRKDSDNLTVQFVESFSCRRTYASLYIDICDRTEKLLTSVGHIQFAMKVRTDLARFYILLKEYDLSEGLLKPAAQIYKDQRWSVLHADILTLLSECHLARNEFDSYLVALPMLCCANSIDEDERQRFTSDFLRLSQDTERNCHTLDCELVLNVIGVKIKLVGEKGHVGDVVNVELSLCNNFLEPIPCQEIFIGLKYSPLAASALSPRERAASPPLSPRRQGLDQYEVVYDNSEETPEKPAEFSFNSKIRYSLFRRNHMSRTQILRKGLDTVDGSDKPMDKEKVTLLTDPWAKVDFMNGTSPSKRPLDKKPTLLKLVNSNMATEDSFQDNTRSRADSDNLVSGKKSHKKSMSLVERAIGRFATDHLTLTKSKSVDAIDDLSQFEEQEAMKRSYILQESASVEVLGTQVTGALPAESNESASFSDTVPPMPEVLEPPDSASSSVSLEEIKPESTEDPVDRLECKNLVLMPGMNTVIVSAKMGHTGRYALQNLTCKTGVVHFYKWLGLKRKSRAFFIVFDPPKFKWTSKHLADILLVGSKQQLRVSIANGPGVIRENSVVRLTSPSGLLFHQVPWSSVQLHPAMSKGGTREGAMKIDIVHPPGAAIGHVAHFYMPCCEPYESMNVCIDVTAPADIGDHADFKSEHQISFEYLWLSSFENSTASLCSVFYTPFAVESKVLVSNRRRFVQVLLRGLNQVWLILTQASLTCSNAPGVTIVDNRQAVEKSLNGEEEFAYIWELDARGDNGREGEPDQLEFDFEVSYLIKDNEGSNPGTYGTKITLENKQAAFLVNLEFDGKDVMSFPVKDQLANISVQLKKLGSPASYEKFGEKISVEFDENEFWQFSDTDKYHEVEIKSTTLVAFKMSVTPVKSGWIPYPVPRLMYSGGEEDILLMNKNKNNEDDDLWEKKKGKESKTRRSRLLDSRRTSSSLSDSPMLELDMESVVFTRSGSSIWVDDVKMYTSTAI